MTNPIELSLVELLLTEQAELTAVDRFSQWHDDRAPEALPLKADQYSQLIPATPPAEGQQYAFRVDLDACTGCKACVTACHNLNGLEESETWRSVGMIVNDAAIAPGWSPLGAEPAPKATMAQTVTTACHHCEDPGCLSGCPVMAYDKDPVTGIVKHLDDQCIGCRYCQLKCPYDVPSYSEAKGIVRKCDMCSDRLAVGEAPACVQGCPNEAISIALVPRSASAQAAPDGLLPTVNEAMPASEITRPTTLYVSERKDLQTSYWRAADHDHLEPAEAHDPLAIMLVLVQLSLGTLASGLFIAFTSGGGGGGAAAAIEALRPYIAVAVLATAGLGQLAATAHLGRPQYAFRAFLGWRTSWMSREILTFGAYLGAVSAWAGCEVAVAFDSLLGIPASIASLAALARLPLALASLGLGIAGTLCSAMIYVDTKRAWWSIGPTLGKFVGTSLLLGPLALAAVSLAAASLDATIESDFLFASLVPGILLLATFGAVTKFGVELAQLRHLWASEATARFRSASLLTGVLRPLFERRIGLGAIGGLAIPVVLYGSAGWADAPGMAAFMAPALAGLALLFAAAGEFIERHLFFRASASRAMPGE